MTIETIVNQATNKQDNGLKRGVWTTKLAEAINSGNLVIDVPNENVNFTVDAVPFKINLQVLALRSLFEAAKGDVSFADLVTLMSEGYLSIQQQRTIEGVEVKEVKEPTGLTPEQYYSNCVKLALDVSNFSVIDDFVKRHYNDNSTKAILLKVIHDLQNLFFNPEQRAVYNVKVEKEEIAKEEAAKLAVKFANLPVTSTPVTHGIHKDTGVITYKGEFTSTVGIKKLLTDNHFVFVSNLPADLDTGTTVIFFKDGAEEPLI